MTETKQSQSEIDEKKQEAIWVFQRFWSDQVGTDALRTKVGREFYKEFFTKNPQYRKYFGDDDDISDQVQLLMRMFAMFSEQGVELFKMYGAEIIDAHSQMRIAPEAFSPFCEGLVTAFKKVFGHRFMSSDEAAFRNVFEQLAKPMREACKKTADQLQEFYDLGITSPDLTMSYEKASEIFQNFWMMKGATAPDIGLTFYHEFFTLQPEMKVLFTSDLKSQYRLLHKMITLMSLQGSSMCMLDTKSLIEKHVKMSIHPRAFKSFGHALVIAFKKCLGDDFAEEEQAAFRVVFQHISEPMVAACTAKKVRTKKLQDRVVTLTREMGKTPPVDPMVRSFHELWSSIPDDERTTIGTEFYSLFFSKHPQYKKYFKNHYIDEQVRILTGMFSYFAQGSELFDKLAPEICLVHAGMRIDPEAFEPFRECLVETMVKVLGDKFTEENKTIFNQVYRSMAKPLMKACREAQESDEDKKDIPIKEATKIFQEFWLMKVDADDMMSDIGLVFYNEFFKLHPECRIFFKEDLKGQAKALMGMISAMATQGSEMFTYDAKANIKRHARMGIKPRFFKGFGHALIIAFKSVLGDEFTDKEQRAFRVIYKSLSDPIVKALEARDRRKRAKESQQESGPESSTGTTPHRR